MASLIKKKKANTIYYYVVESARVDGKPRIVHQTYLGTAKSVARLAQDRSAPIPLSATTVDFGLPGALWLAAEKSGVFALLHSLWPKPRSGPSPAHYLLLAAIHRICQPGPKTEVADWYRASILSSLWGFAPERFTSQAFWDCFDTIATASPCLQASGMNWKKPSCGCSAYGRKSSWSPIVYWLTTPPTSTPIFPPTR